MQSDYTVHGLLFDLGVLRVAERIERPGSPTLSACRYQVALSAQAARRAILVHALAQLRETPGARPLERALRQCANGP